MKIVLFPLLAIGFSMSLLTGCASIIDGTHQLISVETSPVTDAQCTLANDKGKWFIPSTPGSTSVERSYHNLQVMCQKAGYQNGSISVVSKTKGIAFGNILFGGGIGAGVDIADGAAYNYPNLIQVPMQKK